MRPWHLPLAALAFLAGCQNCNSSAQNSAADAAPSATPEAVPPAETASAKPRKIPTGGAEAAKTLSADVDKRLAALPSSPADRTKLIDDLLLRAEIFGKPSDILKADELTKGWSDLHLARAKALAAAYRFDAALPELDQVNNAPQEANALRAGILLHRGEYDEALPLLPTPIEAADAIAVATASTLAEKMQRPADARRLNTIALQKGEDDPSPLPYALICYRNALTQAQRGDDTIAESWFGSAVRLVPQYAHAAVAIAPKQQPNVAAAALAAIAKTSDDPEVPAARAKLLLDQGKKQDATSLLAEAAKGYDAIVAKLPERYGEPAARFWIGPGNDAKKGLDLARANAKNFHTEDAIVLWIDAAAAAKNQAEVCTAAGAMRDLKYLSEHGRRYAASKCADAGAH